MYCELTGEILAKFLKIKIDTSQYMGGKILKTVNRTHEKTVY